MAVIKKRELQRDGHYQVSLYDAKEQELIQRYSENENGKKDGEEVEYFKGSQVVKRRTHWKDGKKDGLEEVYDKYGDMLTEKEYKAGKCIKKRKHRYMGIGRIKSFLNDHTQIGRITIHYDEFSSGHGRKVRVNDQYVGHTGWIGCSVIEEDGKLAHVTINDLHGPVYDMEFKDGKEYNGYFKIKDTSASHFSAYVCKDGVLDGTVKTDKIDGTFRRGVFSGKEFTNPRMLGSYDASKGAFTDRANVFNDYQGYVGRRVIGYHVYENGEHTKDCVEVSATWNTYGCGWDYEYFYSEPKKDGKLQGEYIDAEKNILAYYQEGELEGPYTEFFDRIGGKKKIEGSYKSGKKEGFWKYYDVEGKIIKQEYYHKGRNCTEKYETLKKVATKRGEIEDKLSEGKDERVVLPKMTDKEKRKAIRQAKKELSR